MKRVASNGFTLLELLIALTVSALLLGAVGLASNTVANEWDRQSTQLQGDIEQALYLVRLERNLAGMFPYQYRRPGETATQLLIEGDDESLVWASTQSPALSGALSVWRLRNDDGVVLDRADLIGGYDAETVVWSEPFRLAEFAAVSFRYASYSEVDREVEWLESWPPEEQGERALELPRAVRVALHREENVNRQGDGERALIVPVRAYRPLEALRGQ